MNDVTRNLSIRSLIVLLTIIMISMLAAPLAGAQEAARVYVRPVDAPDSTLVVDVIAENVTDLYGAEFRLTFDPAILAVQDFKPEQDGIQIEAGTLLPANQGFVVANQANQAEGTVIFAMTLLNPAPAVTGSGPLARVTFNILQDSPSSLNVEHAKLVAVDLQTIPFQTEAFAFGGRRQPPANPIPAAAPVALPKTVPTPLEGEGFPWWIVAAVILVLGILALGGFIVMDGLKSTVGPGDTRPNSRVDNQRYGPSTSKNR